MPFAQPTTIKSEESPIHEKPSITRSVPSAIIKSDKSFVDKFLNLSIVSDEDSTTTNDGENMSQVYILFRGLSKDKKEDAVSGLEKLIDACDNEGMANRITAAGGAATINTVLYRYPYGSNRIILKKAFSCKARIKKSQRRHHFLTGGSQSR